MDNILPIELIGRQELMHLIAERFQRLRLDHFGWSREHLAQKSGVHASTIKRFEKTGQITLENLITLAMTMDSHTLFLQLFHLPEVESIAELEKRTQKRRRRGRTSKPPE